MTQDRHPSIRRTALMLLAAMSLASVWASGQTVLDAADFGLKADGVSDDGPAVREMLERAAATAGSAMLKFPSGKSIHIASGKERYAFRIDQLHNLSIDGGGSTFLLDKELRFLHVTSSRDFRMTRLNVDLTRSPVVEATVMQLHDEGKRLLVRLDEPSRASELGGPTQKDGEQAFFGMLWLPDGDVMQSSHYYIDAVKHSGPAGSGMVELVCPNEMPASTRTAIKPGETRISLPVPGIAHRRGPGPMLRIDRCQNVNFEDVEVWSAPWFAFEILRNGGEQIFRRVHVRPKPDSGRTTSSWRDGFHAKGNRGSLLFEDCILEGMNDDAFNISTHAWFVEAVPAPDRARIRQVFPIYYMPLHKDGEVLAISSDGARRLGPACIAEISGAPENEAVFLPEHHKAPVLELTFTRPIEGLAPGCILWDLTSANPATVIRGCRIRKSCRIQSPVTMERCDVAGLLMFYCDDVEGPMPSGSIVRDSTLRRGRGNDSLAVAINGWRGGRAPAVIPPAAEFPLRDLRFERNIIHGGFHAIAVNGLALVENQFLSGPPQLDHSTADVENFREKPDH